MFFVGSGVQGLEAPVFLQSLGAPVGGTAFASSGVTAGVSAETAGSTGVSAKAGVTAKSNATITKLIDAFFI